MDKNAVDFFQEALAEYGAQRPQEALAYFYLALREVDGQMERELEENILINIAQIYDEEGEKDKALSVYQIMALRYQTPEAYYGQGMIYEDLGQRDRALDLYQKALAIDPAYRDALFFMANLYDVQGEKDQAIQAYQRLLDQHPDDFMAWNNLGSILEELGAYDQARDHFKASIYWNRDYFRSHFNLGIVYQRLGQRDLALDQYLLAKNLEKDPDIYLNISAFFIEDQDYESANKYLSEGIYYQDQAPNLYYNRACTWIHLGDLDQAQADALRALELNPQLWTYMQRDPDFANLLAGLEEAQGIDKN